MNDIYLVTVFLKPRNDHSNGTAIKLGPFATAQEAETRASDVLADLYREKVPHRYKNGSKVSWILPEQFSGVCYDVVNPTNCGGR